jgi:hypothetical protein
LSPNVLGLTKIELPTNRTFPLKNVLNLALMGRTPGADPWADPLVRGWPQAALLAFAVSHSSQ